MQIQTETSNLNSNMLKIKNKTNILKVILAVLFIICLFDMRYSYFELIRFFGTFGFIYLASINYAEENRWWYFWTVSALLLNPFLRISLDRLTWNIIDIIWAILLIVSIYLPIKDKILK